MYVHVQYLSVYCVNKLLTFNVFHDHCFCDFYSGQTFSGELLPLFLQASGKLLFQSCKLLYDII